MKALPVCLVVLSLLMTDRSVNAAEEGLKLIPELPVINSPLLVYVAGEGIDEKTFKWHAFHSGKPLDPKTFAAKECWLKVHAAQAGEYTFVASYKAPNGEESRSRTISIGEKTLEAKKANVAPKTAAQLAQEAASTTRASNAVPASSIQKTLDFRSQSIMLNVRGHEALALTLADELERVARSAISEKQTVSQLVEKVKSIWSSQQGAKSIVTWDKLEGLLKDASLQFGKTEVEQSPASTTLVLVSLASLLRADVELIKPRSEVRQAHLSLERIEFASIASTEPSLAYTTNPSCCRTYRVFQRR